ncbi:MAG: Imidazole glycerol phosphate synthase subunit HisF [bacterium ADurb.Bin431]|nr:MAG: Imidazole glycerol phosphate synthase subunit HisF [bacterium ADurb.Bin431]
MDCDGTGEGYDLELTGAVSRAITIPVIASGGCGTPEHIHDVFALAGADAALAASIFHYRRNSIPEVKRYLAGRQIPVRL